VFLATSSNFRDFVIFLLILVDFLLSKIIFESIGGGTTFFAERVGGPPVILTLDPLWSHVASRTEFIKIL
jgi:hypothetical protein